VSFLDARNSSSVLLCLLPAFFPPIRRESVLAGKGRSTDFGGVVKRSGAGRYRGGPQESARAVFANRSGGPAGSRPSRGTIPVYFPPAGFGQHAWTATTRLLAQRLRTCLPAATLESAVLPGPGVPEGSSPLAERAATRTSPPSAGGAPAACGCRAAATGTAASGPCGAGAGRTSASGRPVGAARVVTQEKNVFSFLPSARLLRAAAAGRPRAGTVLRLRLP